MVGWKWIPVHKWNASDWNLGGKPPNGRIDRIVIAPTEQGAVRNRIERARRPSLEANNPDRLVGVRLVDGVIADRSHDVADPVVRPVVGVVDSRIRLAGLARFPPRKPVAEHGSEGVRPVNGIREDSVAIIPLVQVERGHGIVCHVLRLHETRRIAVEMIKGIIVRKNRPDHSSCDNCIRHVLEDVIDHEIVCGVERLDSVTHRRSVAGSVEIAISDLDV